MPEDEVTRFDSGDTGNHLVHLEMWVGGIRELLATSWWGSGEGSAFEVETPVVCVKVLVSGRAFLLGLDWGEERPHPEVRSSVLNGGVYT
jgi:hypothetical protein